MQCIAYCGYVCVGDEMIMMIIGYMMIWSYCVLFHHYRERLYNLDCCFHFLVLMYFHVCVTCVGRDRIYNWFTYLFLHAHVHTRDGLFSLDVWQQCFFEWDIWVRKWDNCTWSWLWSQKQGVCESVSFRWYCLSLFGGDMLSQVYWKHEHGIVDSLRECTFSRLMLLFTSRTNCTLSQIGPIPCLFCRSFSTFSYWLIWYFTLRGLFSSSLGTNPYISSVFQ